MHCVGLMRVKNESRWIKRAIESLFPLCTEVIVFDDHSTDGTPDIARHAGARVIRSPFNDRREHRDREHMLQIAIGTAADWAIVIDGDEELDCKAPAQLREAARTQVLITFKNAQLWNDPNTVRVDSAFGHSITPAMFKLFPGLSMHGHATAGPLELHGGRIPYQYRDLKPRPSGIIWHYGNMLPEDRERKYKFYTENDTREFVQAEYLNALKEPTALETIPVSEFRL